MIDKINISKHNNNISLNNILNNKANLSLIESNIKIEKKDKFIDFLSFIASVLEFILLK